jgi:hypothetical protein
MCTDLVVCSGGNVEDILLSQSAIWRAQKKTIQQNAAKLKMLVKKAAVKAIFPIIAHFDGKIIEDITNGKKEKRDRFAVSANIDETLSFLKFQQWSMGLVLLSMKLCIMYWKIMEYVTV